MTARIRTPFLPAGVLCMGCAAVFSSASQKSTALVRPLSTLPYEVAGTQGVDVKIHDDELRVAGVSSYLFRTFERAAMPAFSLYVGYYERQTQGQTIHSPRNCLPGNGWDFVESAVKSVSTPAGTVQINRSVVANHDERALVYYWYQGRGRVEANEYRVKWELLRDAAIRGRTEEALVRIVVPLAASATAAADLERADSLATRVASQVVASVTTVLPAWQ